MLESLDWGIYTPTIIGLTLNIVGLVFLASGITFKKPKRVLHEYFGVEKAYPLRTIRDYVLNKTQVYIGFVFLIVGYSFQIWSSLGQQKAGSDADSVGPNLIIILAILLVSIILLTIVLKIVQFAWTRVVFRHLMIDFFRDHDWELVKNIEVAKQIGSLLKIPRNKDDSIEEYVLRVQHALHIPTVKATSASKGNKGSKGIKGSDRPETRIGQKAPAPATGSVHPATPPRIG